jgi:lipoprotein-releasing system permease protein
MRLSFPYAIAHRHLRAFRSSSRLTVSASVGIAGIAIGVAALIIAVSVMNGYATVVKDRLLGVNAHLTVRKAYSEPFTESGTLSARLGEVAGVVSATRYAQAEGFLLSKGANSQLRRSGCIARGVTQQGVEVTTSLSDRIVEGRLSLEEVEPGVYSAVIGKYLAEKLNASPGDEIHLSTLPRELLLGGLPPLRRYVVAGVFATGYYEFDSNLVLVPLRALQRDMGWGEMVSGIRLRLEDPFAVDHVGLGIKDILDQRHPGLFTSSWIYEHGNLYVWIRMQTWFSGIALSLIVIVAAFNVISIMTMSVIERRAEIGILKAMGSSRRQIGTIFTAEGLAIGLSGVLIGDLIAFSLCWLQGNYEWIRLRGDVYLISALPVDMSAIDFVAVSVGAIVLCFLFTRLPARDAGAQDPAEAIRAA